jgi:hypothetical protein
VCSADEVSIEEFARSAVIENIFHTKLASPEWSDMLGDSDTKKTTLRTRKVVLVLENGSTTVPCFYAHTSDTIKFSIHHPGCINLFYNTQQGTLELDSYFYYSARHSPVCKSTEPISEVKVIEELAKALDALFIINIDVHSYVCSDNNRTGVRSSDDSRFWGVRYDMGNRPWEHHEHLLLTYFYIASYLQYYCQSHAAISSIGKGGQSQTQRQNRSQSRTRAKKNVK